MLYSRHEFPPFLTLQHPLHHPMSLPFLPNLLAPQTNSVLIEVSLKAE